MKKAVHLSGFYPIQQKSIYPEREQMLFSNKSALQIGRMISV